jgi:2'-5' RNA ligase
MIRVFFGLPLPEASLVALAAAQTRAKSLTTQLEPRWTRPEQMHVTLKFVGGQPEAVLPRLTEMLVTRARAATPFEATLSRVSTFGGERARVLVVDVETASPVLGDLARGLEDDAASLGVARETRDFHAHVTLARFKRPGDPRTVIDAAQLAPVALTFREICLYRSELTPAGSRYAIVATWALGQA